MEVYHKTEQEFNFDVNPLPVQFPDYQRHRPRHHRDEERAVKLEINFTLFENYKFYSYGYDEEDGVPCLELEHHPHPAKEATCTIDDVAMLDTEPDGVKLLLLERLTALYINEDWKDVLVEEIMETGQRLGRTSVGCEVLRVMVDMKRDHIMDLCGECTHGWMQLEVEKSVKRGRVVADDEEDVGVEDGVEGRKRRRVVRESEVCPICLEQFVVGLEDVSFLPCSHVFHGECIRKWLGRSRYNCPTCRFELPIEEGKIVLLNPDYCDLAE